MVGKNVKYLEFRQWLVRSFPVVWMLRLDLVLIYAGVLFVAAVADIAYIMHYFEPQDDIDQTRRILLLLLIVLCAGCSFLWLQKTKTKRVNFFPTSFAGIFDFYICLLCLFCLNAPAILFSFRFDVTGANDTELLIDKAFMEIWSFIILYICLFWWLNRYFSHLKDSIQFIIFYAISFVIIGATLDMSAYWARTCLIFSFFTILFLAVASSYIDKLRRISIAMVCGTMILGPWIGAVVQTHITSQGIEISIEYSFVSIFMLSVLLQPSINRLHSAPTKGGERYARKTRHR